MMWPDELPPNFIPRSLWDTADYWERREARERLMLAKQRAQKDRPRRKRRLKLAKASRRRNRKAA
jgi:hypothetical protein